MFDEIDKIYVNDIGETVLNKNDVFGGWESGLSDEELTKYTLVLEEIRTKSNLRKKMSFICKNKIPDFITEKELKEM